MWLCMKWHGAWLYGVHRTCAKTATVSCGTSHASTVGTPLQWIFKKRTIKIKMLVIHVESHASAASLLESREQCYTKAIIIILQLEAYNNNINNRSFMVPHLVRTQSIPKDTWIDSFQHTLTCTCTHTRTNTHTHAHTHTHTHTHTGAFVWEAFVLTTHRAPRHTIGQHTFMCFTIRARTLKRYCELPCAVL